jgi:hypothetical protein
MAVCGRWHSAPHAGRQGETGTQWAGKGGGPAERREPKDDDVTMMIIKIIISE